MFRSLQALKKIGNILLSKTNRTTSQSIRSSSDDAKWYYRALKTEIPKGNFVKAEIITAFMWYWVLFHMWYDFDHMIGHFEYPDPSKWTDKELGIPALDED